MMISTRNGFHGRTIRRATKDLFGLGAGYALADHKPTLEVTLDDQNGNRYTINFTAADLDKLMAAREHYRATGTWRD